MCSSDLEGKLTYDPENRPFNDGQAFQVPASGAKEVAVSYNKAAADDQKSLGWMAVVLDNDQGTPEAVTGALTGGGTTPTVPPTNPAPTGSASPGDPSAPVSPIPTSSTPRTPLKPGLPRTGDLV